MNALNIINTIIKYTPALKGISEATQQTMENVGLEIVQDTEKCNAFLKKLVDRICTQDIMVNPIFENPLAIFKSGEVPFGSYNQTLYVNPANEQKYTMDSQDLLKVIPPDVKATYYGTIRESKYTVSINDKLLLRAFTGNTQFSELISAISTSLGSGDNIDEFEMMKYLLVNAYINKRIPIIKIEGDTVKEQMENLLIAVKTYSGDFQLPSTEFNGYNIVHATEIQGGEKPVKMWTPPQNQSFITTNTVNSLLDVKTYAAMFNEKRGEIPPRKILVNNFADKTGNTNAVGFLIDNRFIKVEDIFTKVGNFNNDDNLDHKCIRHHHQRYGYNIIANAIAFEFKESTQTQPTENQG